MQNPSRNAPCRLHVILASHAPTAVILRRGPTKWYQIIKWDTSTDTFENGQWFNGRIYENECGLSPDGTKLVYLAANYASHDRDICDRWTGVSKIPYLTAIAFYAQSYHGGGGYFISDGHVHLHFIPVAGTNTVLPYEGRCPRELEVTASWDLKQRSRPAVDNLKREGWTDGKEKHHPDGQWALRVEVSNIQRRKYFVFNLKRALEISLAGATWADWDQRGRLVFAKNGKLFVGEVDIGGNLNETEIADFNSLKPERVKVPEWAKVW